MLTESPSPFLRLLRYAHSFLGGVLLLFLVLIVANTFLVTTYTVHGHSMDTTLHDGQALLVSRMSYFQKPPQRDDIVILYYSGDASVRFVKRIIGGPGDTVTFQDAPLLLGPDQYFVEGDNRDHSTDSRVYGPVLRSQIIGKVVWKAP